MLARSALVIMLALLCTEVAAQVQIDRSPPPGDSDLPMAGKEVAASPSARPVLDLDPALEPKRDRL